MARVGLVVEGEAAAVRRGRTVLPEALLRPAAEGVPLLLGAGAAP